MFQLEPFSKIGEYIHNYYKKGDDYFTYYANFSDATKKIKEIYGQLLEKVNLIFIDDSVAFGKNYGICEEEIEKKEEIIIKPENGNLQKEKDEKEGNIHWIYPGRPCVNISEIFIKLERKEIVKKENDILNVFVVDFIYKKEKGDCYNTILGNQLIKKINDNYAESNNLIIGYTGGESPFIINSADKAGADIVVFKNRGSGRQLITGHNATGNSAGLFDLLWAISWNVSVWKTLEYISSLEIKSDTAIKKIFDLTKSFFSDFPEFDNCSPFWKKYLTNFRLLFANKELEIFFKKDEKKK